MAEHVPGRLGGRGRRLRRGPDGLAPADGARDVDDRRRSRRRCSRRPPRSRTTRASCRSSGARRRPSIPIEIVSDGFGFFIEPALEALGVGELPVVTARTTFEGRRATIAFPNGHPTLPRVRDVQAQPRPRPPGRRSGGRVHRRRRERPLRRRLQRHRVGQTDASSGSASRPAGRTSAGPSSARSTRGWRTSWTRGAPTRRRCRPAPAPVLLRPGGLGRGPHRPVPMAAVAERTPRLAGRPGSPCRPTSERLSSISTGDGYIALRLTGPIHSARRAASASIACLVSAPTSSRRRGAISPSRRCAQPPTMRPSTQIVGPALPALSNSAARCPPRYQSRSFQPMVVASSAGSSATHGSGASLGSRSSARR